MKNVKVAIPKLMIAISENLFQNEMSLANIPKSIDYQKTCSVIPAAPQDTGLSGWLLRQRSWHPGLGFGQHLSELLPLYNLLLGKEVGQFIQNFSVSG